MLVRLERMGGISIPRDGGKTMPLTLRSLVVGIAIFAGLVGYSGAAKAIPTSLIFEGLCDGLPDENVTCDSNTGREWQDLDSTIGLSPNDFFNDIDGWLTAGWSLSLASDVEIFMENAGFTDFTSQELVSQFDAAQLLTSLLSLTNGGMGGDFSQAFADNGDGLATEIFFKIVSPDAGLASGAVNNCCNTFSISSGTSGLWLYRLPGSDPVAVPEPSTLALFVTGLAGLGFIMRRRSRRVQ